MYQDRQEDMDPKVTTVLNEGPKILETLEGVNGALMELYHLKGLKSTIHIDFSCQGFSRKTSTLYYLPKNWDYTKEYKESLSALNETILDAHITFLECERESLIRRWNGLAKELKAEKK